MGSTLRRLLSRDSPETESPQGLSDQQQRRVIQSVLDDASHGSFLSTGNSEEPFDGDLRDWLDTELNGTCFVCVTAEQVDELRELPCFEKLPPDGRRAVGFAHRFDDAVTTYIRLTRTDEGFSISLESVDVTGELTNEIIKQFAQDFGRSISAEFDPLAENNDTPTLRVHPF